MMVGLNWVATNAATEDVANLSFGLDPADVGGYGQDPLNLAAETLRYLGTNVVVSSGNTAGAVTDPGFDPWVITVGAANTLGWFPKVAPFSGSDVIAGVSKPDLVAPRASTCSASCRRTPRSSPANPASLQPNGFYRGSGTSEATAIVSGLAALFVADNPGVTTAQVKASLRVAASPIYAQGSGAGLANVAKRLARSRDDWRMGDAGASGEGNFVTSSWDVNAFGAAILGYRLGLQQVGLQQVGLQQVGLRSVRRPRVRLQQVGLQQVGLQQVGLEQVGFQQVGFEQVGFEQAGAPTPGAASPGEPTEVTGHDHR